MDKEELLRRYHADYQFSFGGLNHIKNTEHQYIIDALA